MYPTLRRACMSFEPIGSPNSLHVPLVAGRKPTSIFMVVDLPHPFEPRKPKISPRGILKLTWSTATKSPNWRVSPSASIAGVSSGEATRGRTTTFLCRARLASGIMAMKASSRLGSPVFASSSFSVPVAMILPSSIAISQSKRSASSM